MKKLKLEQEGFITLMVTLLAVMIAVIVLVYIRVVKAHK